MNGNDGAALEFAGLFKRFGDHVAVDRIDLIVPAGSFFGLVGPNGAGKTTSLSMAVGLLRPDGGTVRIFGRDVWADPVAAKALIGVLPDGMALPVIVLFPAVALLIPGAIGHSLLLRWLAVPAALAWAAALIWYCTGQAVRRLETRGPEIFARVRPLAG